MNITQESTGELTAVVKIELAREDYEKQVNTVLKDYQRKATMPGFRPGKVPMGLVKKMYGKAVLADEVNKVISENLNNYLEENKIKTLGHPLPNEEKQEMIDFDNQENFDFYFDIAMQPEIDVELSDKIKMDYYKIRVDDDSINKYIEDLGKRSEEPVEMNEEFFASVFPGETFKDEAAFRERLGKELEVSFARESDRLFMRQTADKLIDMAKISLPDEFMKRWLMEGGESKVSAEDIEKHYDEYARALRWQMIESKLVTDNNIQVTPEDVREQIMSYFKTPGDVDEEMQQRLNDIANNIMQNEEEVKRIYDQLLDTRMRDLLKSTIKLKDKEVSYDDFIKLASETN